MNKDNVAKLETLFSELPSFIRNKTWTADTYASPVIYSGGMRVLDVRGWGHLTGAGGQGLSSEQAREIQNKLALFLVELVNLAPDLIKAAKEEK